MSKQKSERETLAKAVRAGKMPPSRAVVQYLAERELPEDAIYDLAYEQYKICGCCLVRQAIDAACGKKGISELLDWIDAEANKAKVEGE